MEVWYHPQSLANIMSFANVRKKLKINISTGPNDNNPVITFFRSNGKPMLFKEVINGLYVYNASNDLPETTNENKNIPNKTGYHYSLVSTVYENEKQFTNREIKAAKISLELYYKIGRPSQKVFLYALENNIIRDSATDVKRAFAIYGKDMANIKGKTKRSNPKHVQNSKLIAISEYIMKWHRDATLCIDIFYVNELPFFHTISRKLQFRTVEYIASESHESLSSSLQRVINIY